MTVAELELVPSLRLAGRTAAPLEARYVGDVGESDLALLASERGIKPRAIVRLRDRHHALARCLASGMSDAEASLVTGYDPSRVSILMSDPTFKKLLEDYKELAKDAFADYHERASQVALTALNEIQDRLEETPEEFSNLELLKVAESTADRTGHAPVAKNVNVNLSAELGSRLAAARQRLKDG